MSIIAVQTPTTANGTSSAPTKNFASPTTAGNTLFCWVTASATITAPVGWSTAFNLTGSPHLALFYKENAASLTTVTAGLGGSNGWVIAIAEYSGIVLSGSLDGTPGTGTGPGSGSVTTANANDLILAALAEATIATYSAPTNGFAIGQQGTYNNLGTLTLGWLNQVVSSIGTYSTGVTSSGSAPSAGGIAAFTAAGGVTPPIPQAPAVRVARRTVLAGLVVTTTPLSRPHIGGTAPRPIVVVVRRPPILGRVIRPAFPLRPLPTNRPAGAPKVVRPVLLQPIPRGRVVSIVRQTHSPATGVRARHSLVIRSVIVRAPTGRVVVAPRPFLILPTNRPVGRPQVVYGALRRRAEWYAGRSLVSPILPIFAVPPTGFRAFIPIIIRPALLPPIPRGRWSLTPLPPNGVPPELTNPQCRIFRPSWQAWRWRNHSVASVRAIMARMPAGPASISSTALVYHVYGNGGNGGPIDYTYALVATRDTTWATGILGPGDYLWGVRVSDPTTGLEETNIDARVRLILDGNLIDITNRPAAPYGLTVIPRVGAVLRVRWSWRPGDNGAKSAGWRIWATSGLSVDYSAAPIKTYLFTGMMATFSVDLSGLADGQSYAIGVRSFDAAGRAEPNTIQVVATADGTAPADVGGLLATVLAGGP